MNKFFRQPQGFVGAGILAFLAVIVLFGAAIAPYEPSEFHAASRLQGPSAAFLLGTDQFGRDILSRLLHGARSTILFGVFATSLGTFFGTLLGVTSGYLGGRLDNLIMRSIDGVIAIPDLLFALLIVTVLGGGAGHAMLAVAIAFTPGMARISRSATLSVRTREYVQAAIARGEGRLYIIGREMLPNVLAPVIVEASIRVSFAVMLGATLGFLGLGAQPPSSEWGLMIAEARSFMFRNAFTVLWPGLGIALVAIGFNLAGDALRDALNPRVRG
ncbi:MAG: ABC transporter permease [Proteobacteria bacterium]|nr:ABC transporter permease [Pseudomonadota bacterium]